MKLRCLLLIWLLLTIIYGCTSVKSWERGTLAKPQMAQEPTPLQSVIRAHIYSSREAAGTAGAAQGGGCGCY
ncbi:MAG: DUF4266 domain-containing protein [Gammaproteobacteria bacterium]|nr:DUF4266 domain-containing protein [Gammaproteobacteria bacterium]